MGTPVTDSAKDSLQQSLLVIDILRLEMKANTLRLEIIEIKRRDPNITREGMIILLNQSKLLLASSHKIQGKIMCMDNALTMS